MQLAPHTVLITGGASGIGFALAERFLRAGSQVAICGRRADKLEEAKAKHPGIRTFVCDVGQAADRVALLDRATRELPGLDVLVNNAGIQRRVKLADPGDWGAMREEIAINLEAPIHLSTLFIPHLHKQERPAIVNVTSGLSFTPLCGVPVYCATKAALHSFTLSLRQQLSATPIEVVEIIPPAVDTDLGGPGLHTFGVPLDEFADAVADRLDGGEVEIAYGTAEHVSRAGRDVLDMVFKRMNP
ncbi:MAG TPA: SDR family NAD(P)-dependent oxidoreductase [Thermoanaerobaculia bacterium]|jgi:uncharacterized oxidoreductase|nr:SDR family NAD(P)-dependent oxidoreductase [Thermoanaerobaculia bacterium]